MKRPLASVILFVGAVSAGCGSQARENNPALTGEHLAWDQRIPQPTDLPRYRFAVYIDSVRVELPNASCNEPVETVALCTAPLPAMKPGRHALAMVSYTMPEYIDSPRALPLEVTVAR